VKNEQAWRETCHACPGSGRGQLYPVEKILEQVAVIKI
jgi:hypothetical protein